MDQAGIPLVDTKLRIPVLRSRSVLRRHLVARLTPEPSVRLVLLCAPAGYGKTTVLADWARSRLTSGAAVAWYALDPADDDPIPFGSYLVASLLQALGTGPGRPMPDLINAAQLLRSAPGIDLQRILSMVINALGSTVQEYYLVLDDYQLIAAPAIHSAVAFLVEHLPENAHVVLGSRSDPPLPLARLRSRGQLLEIRSADLRFSGDETDQFLNAIMQLGLSREAVAALEARTEGWIAGLQLAAIALRSAPSLAGRPDKEQLVTSFTGSHRYLVEYLLEEVVGRQEQETQDFLLVTSVLERLYAPLCDALTAVGGPRPGGARPGSSERILRRLEQANLFVVSLDDSGAWYRYHHLFRDFLLDRLKKSRPDRVASLHKAASQWYAGYGFLREAVWHAFATEDWGYAAEVVEQHSFAMMMRSELSTLYKWCSIFPEEVMAAHPLLCLQQSWALAFGGRRRDRERVESRLQQVEAFAAQLQDEQAARDLADHAAIVRSYLVMIPDPTIDPRRQLELAQQRLILYHEDDAARFSTLLTIGYAYLALDQAEEARQALQAARRLALREPLYYGIVETTFQLARLAQLQGQLGRAAELCLEGQTRIVDMLQPAGALGRMELAPASVAVSAADAASRRRAALARVEQTLPAVGCLDIVLGSVLLEQNRLAEAEAHLERGLNAIGWGAIAYTQMAACLALYRLREIQGRPAEALALLSRLEETWPDVAFLTRGLRVMHEFRNASGDLNAKTQVAGWCEEFRASLAGHTGPFGTGPLAAAEAYSLAWLTWMRGQVALGLGQAILPYLEGQLERAWTNGLVGRVIELSLLEATASHAASDEGRSRASLERAIALAEPAGYVRVFDQGHGLIQLLTASMPAAYLPPETAERAVHRPYLERILNAIAVPTSHAADRQTESTVGATRAGLLKTGERLSERELEVLHLMASGASNSEIAEQLVITVGTVKSHINHILGKLEAHNRTEAVARARRLGLIDI